MSNVYTFVRRLVAVTLVAACLAVLLAIIPGQSWAQQLVRATITNATLAVTQSGTWTVQPGNTANTTPWLVTGNTTPADNESPTNAVPTKAFMMCRDTSGSNWDMCPSGSGNIGAVDANTSRVVEAQATGTYIADADETEDEVDANAGEFVGFWVDSLNTTPCYIQVFDDTAANVTVGTTGPDWVFGVPEAAASGLTSGIIKFPAAMSYTALTVAATTTRTGSTGCSAIVSLTVFTR